MGVPRLARIASAIAMVCATAGSCGGTSGRSNSPADTGGLGGTGGSNSSPVDAASAHGGTGGSKSSPVDVASGQGGSQPGSASYDGAMDQGGVGGTGSRACATGSSTKPSLPCRSVNDCGPTGPVKCCESGYICWPTTCGATAAACSTAQSQRFKCTTDSDCDTGGVCTSTTSGCPPCEYRKCVYPAKPSPACIQSPDSCGTDYRCQADGVCAPVSCAEGHACTSGDRCKVGDAFADQFGCAPVPCNEGWQCPDNQRCALSNSELHGCTVLTCQNDNACDCGYCVNGSCQDHLGGCFFEAQ